MRRWVWRALLLAAVMMALTGTALAEEVRYPGGGNSILYDLTNGVGTVLGPVNKAAIENAKIPSKVNGVEITEIAANAFEGCEKLYSVEIGEKVATIGESAFLNCTRLAHLYFPKDSSVTVIEKDAFSGCSQLNNVILPGVTIIKAGTFSRCSALDTIYIPASVEEIEATAFYLDSKLLILHYGNMAKEPSQGDVNKRIVHFSLLSPAQEMEAAKCTVDGKERVTASCEECGRNIITEEHAIPATGHTPGDPVDEVPATCTQTGTTAGSYCTVCGGIAEGLERIDIDPENHPAASRDAYDIPKVDATCTEAGSEGGKMCADCGAVTTEPAKIEALGHDWEEVEDGEWEIITEATCTEPGSKTRVTHKCTRCEETKKSDPEEIDALGHAYVLTETSHVIEYDCMNGHITVKDWVCGACGDEIEYWEHCEDEDAAHTEDDEITEEYLAHLTDKHGGARETPAGHHTPDEDVPYTETLPTCTVPGARVYEEYTCTVCGAEVTGDDLTVVLPALDHDYVRVAEEVLGDASCTQAGLKRINFERCSRCDMINPDKPGEEVRDFAAHKWGEPVSDEEKKDEDRDPTCGADGVRHVVVECAVCHEKQQQALTLPATGRHAWGEWTVVTAATADADGTEKRVCSVCSAEETRPLPATSSGGTSNPGTPDPGTSNPGTSNPGTSNPGTGTPEATRYSIDVIPSSNGYVVSSRDTAKEGDRVTLTVRPNSGYELDRLRITDSDGNRLSYTSLGGGEYRFTMPDSWVEVRASFDRTYYSGSSSSSGTSSQGNSAGTVQTVIQSVPRASAYGQIFSDIPTSHWAAGEINWANQMGYMNGSGGRFNPDGNITHQQLWMVLARLTGSRPANMEDARRWAVNGGFAEGAAPNGAVIRHQLVTALYRCAHLMGSNNRNTTTLAGYADSRTVPSGARDAFAWAVANGIISGNSNGRLDPNGTLTRAQFAVILYRYSQRV